MVLGLNGCSESGPDASHTYVKVHPSLSAINVIIISIKHLNKLRLGFGQG